MNEKTVLVVFKTHLDVGFTDLAKNVLKRYFNDFVINAVKTSDWYREQNNGRNYVWTVGSWLIYEYLEKASPAKRKFLEAAIGRGDIAWHGLPFTTHSELADASLFRYGVSLSTELDRRFGRTTIAAKMTDVPGHTRGIIAPLVDVGIKFLHIGVNPASSVPDVPLLFRWVNSAGQSIIVMYQLDYGMTSTLPSSPLIMHLAVTGDNLGPHTPEQAETVFADLTQRYPEYKIRSGTLNEVAAEIIMRNPDLPVITGEIGDTWIHGVGSDPLKVSRFKRLCRLRQKWENENISIANIPEFKNFSRKLLQVIEHTWGMDEKTWLPGEKRAVGEALKTMQKSQPAQKFNASWREKRNLLTEAIATLQTPVWRQQANDAIADNVPAKPSYLGAKAFSIDDFTIATAHFRVKFHPVTGALNFLQRQDQPYLWFDEQHQGALFSVDNYGYADYERFMSQYLRRRPDWAILDFSKPFLAQNTRSQHGIPVITQAYCSSDTEAENFIFELQLPRLHGIPKKLYLEYSFLYARPAIEVTLQWFDKKAARMPHAFWLSFVPCLNHDFLWQMRKMGENISPTEVISRGGRTLHAIDDYATYGNSSQSMKITSYDAPLMASGQPSLLDFHNHLPDMSGGVHFNLYNNIWGTNFPMWFGDDCRFCFELQF